MRRLTIAFVQQELKQEQERHAHTALLLKQANGEISRLNSIVNAAHEQLRAFDAKPRDDVRDDRQNEEGLHAIRVLVAIALNELL